MSNNVSQLGNNIDWVVGNIFLFSNVNLFIRKRKILPTHIKEILQMNVKQTQQERKSNLSFFFSTLFCADNLSVIDVLVHVDHFVHFSLQ
jgi:hypothetical protein